MKIIVDGQQMTSYNGNTVLYDRSSNFLILEFEFRSGWDGLVKTVQFIKGNTVYNKLMEENDTVVVPSEVTEGDWTLGVFGVNAENAVLATSSGLMLRVKLSAYKDNGSDPVEPTPTLFAQLIERIEECEDVANSVREDADNGVFDGYSPEAFVTKVGKIVRITITDKEGTTSEEVKDGEGISEGGTTGQILKKKSNEDYDTEWKDNTYDDVSNKPKVNNVELFGNKSLADLGIKQTYNKSDVGLGNVDNVRQYSASNPPPYPVTSVNGQTGTVVIDTHDDLIPTQASPTNKLTTENFVNSTVATSTATFRGTYNSLAELEQVTADENDYGFVVGTDSAGNTVYNRYKYASGTWVFEYALNNSSFTAAQWEAIQSGITDDLVTKLQGIEAGAEVNIVEGLKIGNVTQQVSNKIMQINPDTTPTQGSTNVIDSNAVYEVEKLLPTDRESGENVDIDNAQPYKVLDIVADGKYQQGDNPSPDNPQPITQITSATWNRTGKNLMGLGENLNGYADATTLEFKVASKSIGYLFDTSLLPDEITFNCTNGNRANISYYNIVPQLNTLALSRSASSNLPRTITVNKEYKYIHIQFSYNEENVSNIMVEEGSSATTYSPYQGQTIPIDLDGNEVCAVSNTIKDRLLIDRYGNVAIQKNVGKVVFNGSEGWWYDGHQATPSDRTIIQLANSGYKTTQYISSHFVQGSTTSNRIVSSGTTMYISLADSITGVLEADTNQEKLSKMKAWLNTHNVDFYYALETSQIIPLPKLSILPSTLKGINHIWVDTNLGITDIEVEYVEDLSLAIPTKTSELTNDSNFEVTTNKVTSLSSSSTNTQYPSAKCVYDLVGNVESALTTLDVGNGVA